MFSIIIAIFTLFCPISHYYVCAASAPFCHARSHLLTLILCSLLEHSVMKFRCISVHVQQQSHPMYRSDVQEVYMYISCVFTLLLVLALIQVLHFQHCRTQTILYVTGSDKIDLMQKKNIDSELLP